MNDIRIHSFDLNTKETGRYGDPEMQPADGFLIRIREHGTEVNLLLDAGKKGQGEKVILPYLCSQGISHLDYMALSHPHLDHFGGMIDLLRESGITVGKFLYAPLADEDMHRAQDERNYRLWTEFKQTLEQAAAAGGVRTIDHLDACRPGDRIALTLSVGLDIVALPDPSLYGENDVLNINDMSLVLKLHYGSFSALFPGDCGRAQAEQILRSPQRELIRDVTLLKASHHGGDESTTPEFTALCNSRIVLVPCNSLVVEHRPSFVRNLHDFSRNGAKILRADCQRSIEIASDGTVVTCRASTDHYSEHTAFHLR